MALIRVFLQLMVDLPSTDVRPNPRLCGVIVTHSGTQSIFIAGATALWARSDRVENVVAGGDALATHGVCSVVAKPCRSE